MDLRSVCSIFQSQGMAASVIGGHLFISRGAAFIEASLQDEGRGYMKFRSGIFIDKSEDVSEGEAFMAVSELQSKMKGIAISCRLDTVGKFLVMAELYVPAYTVRSRSMPENTWKT